MARRPCAVSPRACAVVGVLCLALAVARPAPLPLGLALVALLGVPWGVAVIRQTAFSETVTPLAISCRVRLVGRWRSTRSSLGLSGSARTWPVSAGLASPARSGSRTRGQATPRGPAPGTGLTCAGLQRGPGLDEPGPRGAEQLQGMGISEHQVGPDRREGAREDQHRPSKRRRMAPGTASPSVIGFQPHRAVGDRPSLDPGELPDRIGPRSQGLEATVIAASQARWDHEAALSTHSDR